jgi:molybdopterin/thiamine biosynthesis adenylyltransferase
MSDLQNNLTDAERAVYEWQLDVPGFGEAGQAKLKRATVLISRVGGLGGAVAYNLAAAGVDHLILAHAGNVRPADLNRQILMTHAGLGRSRVESAARRLAELNPSLRVTAVAENVTDASAEHLVGKADLVVDAAPLFAERFALNRAAVRLNRPMVECAVYELQVQLTTIVPRRTPCLACIYPEDPPAWRRRFPVFGAVAGAAGGLAAMEAIKVLAGLGEPLAGRLLTMDLRSMATRCITLTRRPDCPVCG